MYISKKKAWLYGVIILLIVIVSHAIMIINRADLMQKEREMLELTETGSFSNEARLSRYTENEEIDFFVEFRLERERVRSHRIDILAGIIDNKDMAVEIKTSAQTSLQSLLNLCELEMQVEALLLAKGFEEAVICWQDNAVNVIIREEGLTPVRAVQIRDLVARSLAVNLEDVVVIEK